MTSNFVVAPIYLLALWSVLTNRHRLTVFLVCCTWTMDLLSLEGLGADIPVFRFIGLLLLPSTLGYARRLLGRSPAMRAIAVETMLLLLLAILFGYLFPWPDLTHERGWNQQAQGRAVISMMRQLADLSVMLYLANQASSRRMVELALKAILVGVFINIGIGALDRLSGLHAISAIWGEKTDQVRMSGLNGEPRVLGRVCGVGLLVALLSTLPVRLRAAGVLASLFGLLMAGSTSALGGLAVATATITLQAGKRMQFVRVAVLLVILGALVFAYRNYADQELSAYVEPRIANVMAPEDREPDEPLWVASLEVFDRAAMRFLIDRPLYLLIGAGPDLVSLPASSYISERSAVIYGDRIDSVPHTGAIQLVARTGLIGLGLWILAILLLLRDLNASVAERQGIRNLVLAAVAFSAVVLTPFLFIALGLALGRTLVAARERGAARSSAPGAAGRRAPAPAASAAS